MSMLEIQHLSTDFETENGMVHAVRDVSLSVDKGEVLGIVGESGSGKSQTMFSVMGLLSGNGIVKDGSITIDGKEISPKAFSDRKEYEQVMDHIRGNDLAMIFQDPMTFLNPVLRIETQLMEPILNHMDISKEEAKKRAIELMRKVGIPSPEARIRQYPHQFSGGMRQRIIIAIALACDPKIIIADEPTTALDVTIQAQILDLMNELRESYDTSVIMITHDLGVIAETCEEVAVFYAGQVVEQSDVNTIFHAPAHPYTAGLLRSVLSLGGAQQELYTIQGTVPTAGNFSVGCRFADRCEHCMDICCNRAPALSEISPGHLCRCWLHADTPKEETA